MTRPSYASALALALPFACAAFLAAQPAAAESRFQPPVEAEVLEGWVASDGTRMAAIQLTLMPGWKTYWRAPGDAGIPPVFHWTGSRNVGSVAIAWPTPKVFEQNGMRSVGYDGTLVLPIRIEPARRGEPVELRTRMELGVCSDVCLPVELEFGATIDTATGTPTPAIAAALAAQPFTSREAGVTAAECVLQPTEDGLIIETRITMPSSGGEEYVVIEPGPSNIWVGEARTRRSGNQIVATSEMISLGGGPIALDRSAIRITVLGRDHAVDVLGCTAG